MSWLRYVRLLLPVVLQAIEMAAQISENKQYQRRFMKYWVEESIPLLQAVMTEVQERLEDEDDPLTLEHLP